MSKILITIPFCVFFTLNLLAASKVDWKKIKDEDGIVVYRGDIKKSPVVAFRGVGEIKASVKAVTSVLYNIDRKLEWVSKIKTAKIIRTTSDFEVVEYNETHAPWPINNRDFLFTARLIPENNWKKITIEMTSVEDSLMPAQKGIVRGKIHSSRFVLQENKNGHTNLAVEIHADPMGMIPKWLANLFQKHWPYQTIQNMRKEVNQKDFKVHPHIEKLFSKHLRRKRP